MPPYANIGTMSNPPTQSIEPAKPRGSIEWSVVGTLIILIAMGLCFRAANLDAIGFAEDEVNKVDAVHAYERGDITANAEHPMLMKVLMYASVKVGRFLKGQAISDEVLFRLPN